MTATERARRADALYFDTNSIHRRQLCEMVANRESDLEDARAVIHGYKEQVVALSGLVRDLWDAWQGSEFSMMPKLAERMRELGIEADQ